MKRKVYDCAPGCPIESTLQIISGKWKSIILFHLLKQKVCRFNELNKLIPKCSRRMLSLQLNELEKDKVISKTVYPVIPPKTEYRLTSFGLTLKPIILAMETWGNNYNYLKQHEQQLLNK